MKSPKRLSVAFLYDDTLDSTDAVAQQVKLIGAWLSGQGHSVTYLVGETKMKEWAGGKIYSLAKNQTVYFNGNKMSMPLLADGKLLREVLKQSKFDVLHVMVPYSPLMAQRVINQIDPATAIVGTFHIYPSGLLSKGGSRLLRAAYGRSLGKFAEIVSVSRAAAEFAKKAYGIDSKIIPNSVDVATFSVPKPKHHASGQSIVYLGRLVKRKGCRQLIEAFALASRQSPNTRLIIAGAGPLRHSLEKLAAKLKVDGKVEFIGYVDEADKPKLLAGADIACFPSIYGESFGIVLIEAMAAGAGVVLAGDNPGYRTVLEAQPRLLINPRDKYSFAARLAELLENTQLRRQLHEWQQSTVGQYDINVVGQQILGLYRTAIARTTKKSNNKAHE